MTLVVVSVDGVTSGDLNARSREEKRLYHGGNVVVCRIAAAGYIVQLRARMRAVIQHSMLLQPPRCQAAGLASGVHGVFRSHALQVFCWPLWDAGPASRRFGCADWARRLSRPGKVRLKRPRPGALRFCGVATAIPGNCS